MTLIPRLLLATALFSSAAHAFTASIPVAPVPAFATARVASVQVRVALDHGDWTYQPGEHVKFTVTVMADNEPIDGATISYKFGPEMLPMEEKTATVPAGGFVIDGGTLKRPGFLRCIVTAQIAGKTYRSLGTAGFAPDKIQPTQAEPADFDAFWDAGKAELAKVPLDAQVTLLPDACTPEVNVYHVSFRTIGSTGGSKYLARIYGILCEPKAPGKYPAVLSVPGAGVRPYYGNKARAARGVISLEIGIHGIPVNLPPELYDQLRTGGLYNYQLYNLDNKDAYYYRRVYLSCVRANDFLTSRENYDGENLVVTGGSQGGQLTIVTTALDPRVKGCAAQFPAFCDVTGYLHGRAGGWPGMFKPDPKTGENFHATPAKIATTAYYDTVNFAKRIKVPGQYTWGYNDEVCPPTSTFSAYNQIKAPKQLFLELEANHPIIPEAADAVEKWLGDFLKLAK